MIAHQQMTGRITSFVGQYPLQFDNHYKMAGESTDRQDRKLKWLFDLTFVQHLLEYGRG